jgi:agmatinase
LVEFTLIDLYFFDLVSSFWYVGDWFWQKGDFHMDKRTAPAYAGIATFMRAPMAELSDLREGDIAILGIPFDTTCGSRQGARFGPRGIREGSLHFMYQLGALTKSRKEMVDVHTGERFRFPPKDILKDVGDSPVYPADIPKTAESIRSNVKTITEKGSTPVILGGDHYVTWPAFAGFAAAHAGQGKIGYVHIDSHLDLTDDTEAWGKDYHGSTARRISEMECIDLKSMVWIGIGGSCQTTERWEFVQKNGCKIFTSRDISDQGIGKVTREAIERASEKTETVYVTIDIDVVDHAFAPGTGSYVFGGITSAQFLELMDVLGKTECIGGLDLVEVAPPLDPTGATSRLAATGLISFLRPRLFDTVKI